MSLSVPIDVRDVTITPIFKHITVEDVPESERAGHAVMKTVEVVEVRFAGQKTYSPVFPVDAQFRREGARVITYAERWADQYAEFVSGDDQIASGTPLEMLRPFGITDSLLSLCRALKIYSIEALHHLEGPAAKSLGMHTNTLKGMAQQFMDQRNGYSADRVRIAELEAMVKTLQQPIPPQDPAPAEADAALAAADADKEALKARLTELTGARPRGNPSLETLRQMVQEAEA